MFEVITNKKGTVTVTGAMTIREIDSLYQELCKIVTHGNCSMLDCTEVTEIDTAGLQVLIAFKRSFLGNLTTIDILLSNQIVEALQLTGLNNVLKAA